MSEKTRSASHCCIAWLVILAAQSQPASRYAMPRGLEDLRIGMSYQVLKKARPRLIETFYDTHLTVSGNPFFDRIDFKFHKGYVSEMRFTLSRGVPADRMQQLTPGFVRGIHRLWGSDSQRFVCVRGRKRGELEHPGWLWRKGGVTVVAVLVSAYQPFRGHTLGGFEVVLLDNTASIKKRIACLQMAKNASRIRLVFPPRLRYAPQHDHPVFH